MKVTANAWSCLPVMLLASLVAEAYLAASEWRDRNPTQRPIRVLTYNIHHGEGLDGRVDLPRLAAVIENATADMVALQEVDRGTRRSGGVDQLGELGRLTGMHAAFGKAMEYQGGDYGVGVLTRRPARRVMNRRLPGSPDRESRTALTVELELGGRGSRLQFTTTHFDNGRESMDKVAQASYLATVLSRGDDEPGILAGDMNTRSDTEPMQILARRWTDTFFDPPPDSNGRSRRRIDYVMVRPAAAWRVLESRYVDAPLASDHQPVLVVLEWIGTAERTTSESR